MNALLPLPIAPLVISPLPLLAPLGIVPTVGIATMVAPTLAAAAALFGSIRVPASPLVVVHVRDRHQAYLFQVHRRRGLAVPLPLPSTSCD